MIFKIMIAAVAAFIIALLAFPVFIKRMKVLQYGQQIREDGPRRHSVKAGTPTMGGIVIISAAVLVSIILAGFSYPFAAVLLVAVGCGLIGFFDDYFKVAHSRSLGLKARTKIILQLFVAAIFILLLRHSGIYSPEVVLPFLNTAINLGLIYPLFVFLVIISATNSVNLTDGIDGLAAGTSIISLAAFIYIATLAGMPAVALFCAALAGACLAFLIYNRYPARIFMGDAGSLALGGAFAAVAVLSKAEFFLIIIGGVFVLEALSVIAQVACFQLTGRRILLMSPLHHHFELKGWSEWRVAGTFWAAALVFAVVGTLAYSR